MLSIPLPGVEFFEATVQVCEGSDEEPPAVDAHTFVVVEVRVQDEHRVDFLTVPQGSHQCWVVMQPESLAEPVYTCMSHNDHNLRTHHRHMPGVKQRVEDDAL